MIFKGWFRVGFCQDDPCPKGKNSQDKSDPDPAGYLHDNLGEHL